VPLRINGLEIKKTAAITLTPGRYRHGDGGGEIYFIHVCPFPKAANFYIIWFQSAIPLFSVERNVLSPLSCDSKTPGRVKKTQAHFKTSRSEIDLQ
jgi:hypothetical protein